MVQVQDHKDSSRDKECISSVLTSQILVAPSWMKPTLFITAFRVDRYPATSRCDAPIVLIGKEIRIVFVSGSASYGLVSFDSGLKMKGIVSPLPERDVAATWIPHSSQSGIRKVEVQPAPKMTRSTDMKNGLQRRNGAADMSHWCHFACFRFDASYIYQGLWWLNTIVPRWQIDFKAHGIFETSILMNKSMFQ